MDELYKLQLESRLAERGFIKETLVQDELQLKLTTKGTNEFKNIISSTEGKRMFLQMVVEDAKKYSPDKARRLVLAAMAKIKECS